MPAGFKHNTDLLLDAADPMFPVSGLDFWRLPAVALVIAIAVAIAATDLMLLQRG